jgi:hypothetical protein
MRDAVGDVLEAVHARMTVSERARAMGPGLLMLSWVFVEIMRGAMLMTAV